MNCTPFVSQYDIGFGTTAISMDARELARVILHDPNYKEGQPVWLLACNTGKLLDDGDYCVSEHLANMLGAEVSAPSDVLLFGENGKLTVGWSGNGRFVLAQT